VVGVGVTVRRSEPDGVLAGQAARGDGVAFAELARRYGDLIGYCTHMPAWGHDREDERQEALIGLFEACRVFDPARGTFGAIATVRVRSRVRNARERVRAGNIGC
jgi:DNA-directed RNA polymerase specialized sigma subunit